MPWLTVEDYGITGWSNGVDRASRSRHYCAELESGTILFFPAPPFDLPPPDIDFLLALKAADSRVHKNISYRPESDLLRGLSDDVHKPKVHEIMRRYAGQARQFVEDFLSSYSDQLQMDYASFRPLEEEGRNLPLHKRNDLLHVDAFPSRPTRGGRILRVFTNIHRQKDRTWMVGHRFSELAHRYANAAGVRKYAHQSKAWIELKRGLVRVGLPFPERSPYDEFMLHFHDWLKENAEFQDAKDAKEHLAFPSMATWVVFTDGVSHAALSGQFAMEQTFIVPLGRLVKVEASPLRVLESIAGRAMN
jgi:hypothetical protein